MAVRPKTHLQLMKGAGLIPDREKYHSLYNYQWQQYRINYLHDHPLCVDCLAEKRTTAATIVDHIIPHRGNYQLFWSPRNHQAMCKDHHDIKTGKGQ